MQRDTGLYRYVPYRGRPKIKWPNGAHVAFWVAPNIEHYELRPPGSLKRRPWGRPEPDVLNYSWRDYGNRVGFDRIADTMARYGVRGSVSLNAAVCDHFPDIIERCMELKWEFFGHGIYNTRYMYDLPEEDQRHMIRDCRDTIKKKTGQTVDGWLTPAITSTFETPHILADEGLIYSLDYFHDDQPLPLNTRGRRMVSVPYSLEVNDPPLLIWRHTSPRGYVDILKAQFDRLYAEGATNGTVMGVPVHPYVLGQPHRHPAFAEVLSYITSHDKVWLATGREIANWYIQHHLDEVSEWMSGLKGNC